jgi:hypothetical protein
VVLCEGTALIIRTERAVWGVRKLCCDKNLFSLTENTLSHHKQQVNAVQVHSQDNTTRCISTLYWQNAEHEQPPIMWRMQTAERFGHSDRSLRHTMQDLCLHLIQTILPSTFISRLAEKKTIFL